METRVIQRLHVQHVHVLLEQLDDFIQLFVVAVAVHKDFKLRVASFGFSGLYVHKVDMAFLEETLRISYPDTVGVVHTVEWMQVHLNQFLCQETGKKV